MKSLLFLIVMLAASPPLHAQDIEACPAYETAKGPEITFLKDERIRKSGFLFARLKPEASGSVSYDDLAGRRARFIGETTGTGAMSRFYEVVLEDCKRVYLPNILERTLSRDSKSLYEYEYTGEDIDPKIEAMRPETAWRTVEKVDPMTDEKSCYVTGGGLRDALNPMFFYHSREGFSILLVGADFPGKASTFRVDKNKALSGIESISGARAQALVGQLRSGRVLRVAGYKWPYEVEEYEEYKLGGDLGANLDACKAFIRK